MLEGKLEFIPITEVKVFVSLSNFISKRIKGFLAFLVASIALSKSIPNILERSGIGNCISAILVTISNSKGKFCSFAKKNFEPTIPYIAGSLNIFGSITAKLLTILHSSNTPFIWFCNLSYCFVET